MRGREDVPCREDDRILEALMTEKLLGPSAEKMHPKFYNSGPNPDILTNSLKPEGINLAQAAVGKPQQERLKKASKPYIPATIKASRSSVKKVSARPKRRQTLSPIGKGFLLGVLIGFTAILLNRKSSLAAFGAIPASPNYQ